jgi:paraquat-inducible protein B
VGTFVVVGVAMIVGLALFFGSGKLSRETITLVSFFDGDVSGLRVGAPVTFRGVEVGTVSEVLMTLPEDPRTGTTDVRIAVVFQVDLQRVRSVSPSQTRDLSEEAQFNEIVEAGLRVRIKTTNFLSGMKSLSLDLRPDVPDTRLQDADLQYWEVPTIPSTFTALEGKLEEMANKLAALPLDSMALNINGLVTDLRIAITSPEVPTLLDQANRTLESFEDTSEKLSSLLANLEGEVGPVVEGMDDTFAELRRVLQSVETTLAQVRADMGPDSPLSYRTLQLLEETSMMVQSIREFVEYLNANPSALIKGRSGGGE